MKTTQMSKTIIPALLLGLLIPAAQAQPGNGDGSGRKGPPKDGPRHERIMQNDKDGDGKLSREERQALREARRDERHAEILAKYDADKDGVLSEQERAKVRKEMGPPPERRKEMKEKVKQRFDKDGDGVLSEAEREQAREQMQNRKGPKPGANRPAAE